MSKNPLSFHLDLHVIKYNVFFACNPVLVEKKKKTIHDF